MNQQILLEKIERRAQIKTGLKPRVVFSLSDWQLIKDIILELSSPKLLNSIKKARRDFKNKKGMEYDPGK